MPSVDSDLALKATIRLEATVSTTIGGLWRRLKQWAEVLDSSGNKDLPVLDSLEPRILLSHSPAVFFFDGHDDTPRSGALDGDVNLSDSATVSSSDAGLLQTLAPLPLAGDLNRDGAVDATDIALLRDGIHDSADDLIFDLNGDAKINADDLNFQIEVVLGTNFGDADLNGIVNFVDFVLLSNNFGGSGGWSEGNFNLNDRARVRAAL